MDKARLRGGLGAGELAGRNTSHADSGRDGKQRRVMGEDVPKLERCVQTRCHLRLHVRGRLMMRSEGDFVRAKSFSLQGFCVSPSRLPQSPHSACSATLRAGPLVPAELRTTNFTNPDEGNLAGFRLLGLMMLRAHGGQSTMSTARLTSRGVRGKGRRAAPCPLLASSKQEDGAHQIPCIPDWSTRLENTLAMA